MSRGNWINHFSWIVFTLISPRCCPTQNNYNFYPISKTKRLSIAHQLVANSVCLLSDMISCCHMRSHEICRAVEKYAGFYNNDLRIVQKFHSSLLQYNSRLASDDVSTYSLSWCNVHSCHSLLRQKYLLVGGIKYSSFKQEITGSYPVINNLFLRPFAFLLQQTTFRLLSNPLMFRVRAKSTWSW